MIFVTNRTGGSYNYDDLNRVEGNVFLISELLNEYGYFNDLTVKTDWTTDDFPKETQMSRYIDNVVLLKDTFYSLVEPPTDMNNIDYVDANNIEKSLKSVYDILSESIKVIPVLQFTLGGGNFE